VTHIVFAWTFNAQGGPNDIKGWYPDYASAKAAAKQLYRSYRIVRLFTIETGETEVVDIPSQPEGQTGPWVVFAWNTPAGGDNDIVGSRTGYADWDQVYTLAIARTDQNVVILDTESQAYTTLRSPAP
jgi:hypothetical protein